MYDNCNWYYLNDLCGDINKFKILTYLLILKNLELVLIINLIVFL